MRDNSLSVVIYWLFSFALGAVFGSFLNVCIYRIPLKLSLIAPGSHCPNCKLPIRAYDNIPIISYLLLNGRCRDCKKRIPIRYPFVEFIAGLITVELISVYGFNLDSLSYIVLAYILVVVAFIDLDHLIIPNKVTLLGFVVGLVFVLASGSPKGWTNPLIGAILVGGFLYASGILGKLVFHKESMGFGDVKLGAMIGIFIGWKWGIVALFLSFNGAAIFGLTGLILHRVEFGQRIPFGLFLSLGSVLTLFMGDWIIQFYTNNFLAK